MHRFPEREPFEDLKKIRDKLRKASEKRNSLLHSTWLAGGVRSAITAKERKGLNFEFEDMDSKKIEGISDFIAEVAYEVQEFSLKSLIYIR